MKFKADVECRSCKATGLYRGMAERDGFAVVCGTCKGTGSEKIEIDYIEFKERKESGNVKRVLLCNPGIMIGINEERGFTYESFGGIPYDDWQNLKNPKKFPSKTEDRNHTCPAWFWQTADYKRKPDWGECYDLFGTSFNKCKYFKEKDKCWKRFDNEKL